VMVVPFPAAGGDAHLLIVIVIRVLTLFLEVEWAEYIAGHLFTDIGIDLIQYGVLMEHCCCCIVIVVDSAQAGRCCCYRHYR